MNWEDPIALGPLLRDTRIVPRPFYARDTVAVARDLLGKVVVHGETAGRIVETEAYLGLGDLAAHASKGLTNRTRVIFGPPGHAYVYLSYGANECLNFVAEPDGTPGCVLIRALEPLAGVELMRSRRKKAKALADLASGPGKLTQALDITRRHYGADLTRGELTVRAFREDEALPIATTPRIGLTVCADLPLRFVVADSPFLSRKLSSARRGSRRARPAE